MLGSCHPSTLDAQNNLGSVYESTGRVEDAFRVWEECSVNMTKTLGKAHPDTLR